MQPVVIENISKSYETHHAVKNVSFAVEPGQIFGLIGPDGAGKTSLLRMIVTLLKPDHGTIYFLGKSIKDNSLFVRNNIGYMPQQFSLYRDLTVEQNLRFFGDLFDVPKNIQDQRMERLYAFSRLKLFANRQAGALSGGMKQKLALSCMLMHEPKVLILDEPTTGVDPVSRAEFWQILHDVAAQGSSIVVSTAYIDEAEQCHRVAVMEEGSLHLLDQPADARQRLAKPLAIPPIMTDVPAVVVKDLMRKFGEFTAVNKISFSVNRGEVFGFLGANGAGKTTTIRMLCGLLMPTAGTATVAGYDVYKDYEKIKYKIGYMSQKFSLYTDLTIRENIEFYGGIYGLSKQKIQAKTKELLEYLQLQEYADTLVVELPLGWKQRVALCTAIIHDPEILFLDEPTSGVDPESRRQFWQIIYALAAQHKTIFVTTHFMDEAEYCQRVSIMRDGEIIELDTPPQLKNKYQANSMQEVFMSSVRKNT